MSSSIFQPLSREVRVGLSPAARGAARRRRETESRIRTSITGARRMGGYYNLESEETSCIAATF